MCPSHFYLLTSGLEAKSKAKPTISTWWFTFQVSFLSICSRVISWFIFKPQRRVFQFFMTFVFLLSPFYVQTSTNNKRKTDSRLNWIFHLSLRFSSSLRVFDFLMRLLSESTIFFILSWRPAYLTLPTQLFSPFPELYGVEEMRL